MRIKHIILTGPSDQISYVAQQLMANKVINNILLKENRAVCRLTKQAGEQPLSALFVRYICNSAISVQFDCFTDTLDLETVLREDEVKLIQQIRFMRGRQGQTRIDHHMNLLREFIVDRQSCSLFQD